jgi:phospholipase C
MPITNVREKVDTIGVLMLENRSYDHMFSYLSLNTAASPRSDIDGIAGLLKKDYANESATKIYRPWITNDDPLVADLPHGRKLVNVQLRGTENEADPITMRGFVEAYRQESGVSVVPRNAAPMSVQNKPWMIDYFAANHTVCSRWFAPLPTDTQPNRLMALSGYTNHDTTRPRVLTQKPLVFDWLNDRGIPWRVYRSGLPFELLIKTMWDDVFDPSRFRSVKDLAIDVNEEPPATFPKVIFMEPAFGDSPIRLGHQPNDDHPPTPIGPGQQFMREMYAALSSNLTRWAKTVMIVTYDEHGGFYDHVAPRELTTTPPKDADWTGGAFGTTGVRVPGIVASPLAKGGFVYDKPLDHTSILQFIASVFGEDGETYSMEVDDRMSQGIGNIVDVLTDDPPRPSIPKPPETAPPVTLLGPRKKPEPAPEEMKPRKGENAKAFEDAAREVLKGRSRDEIRARYPELLHWEQTRQ